MIDLREALYRARATGRIPDGLLDGGSDDPMVRAACHVLHAISAAMALRAVEAVEHCDRALELYDRHPLSLLSVDGVDLHREFLWSALTTRAIAVDDEGRLEESVEGHRRALATALAFDYGRGVIVSRTNLARQLMRAGESTEAAFQLFQDKPDRYPEWQSVYHRLINQTLALLYYGSGMRHKALDRARICLEAPGVADHHDGLKALGQLAGLAASMGTIEEAEAVVDLIGANPAAEATPRVRIATETARAAILARRGRVDDAVELLERLGLDELPPGTYEDMVHPRLVLIEVLVGARRFDEALVVVERCRFTPMGRATEGRRRELAAESLAGLGRWREALLALREAHAIQQSFQIDPAHYTRLAFPDGLERDDGIPTSVIADLYARQVRLRDILAHDLRGLFNSVQLAHDSVLDEDDQDVRKRKLRRLVTMINALADVPERTSAYLQLVNGDSEVALGPVAPARIIAEVVSRYQPQAEHRGVTLTILAGPEADIRADADMLRATLSNLVANALKFTADRSRVTVGWRSGADRRSIEVFVADQGPGLSDDAQRRILRRSPSPTDPGGMGAAGSGLGLQIVVGFVERMQGRFRIDNDHDVGLTFTISLDRVDGAWFDDAESWPRNAAPMVEPTPVGAHDAATRRTDAVKLEADRSPVSATAADGLTVLVVDDDPTVVEVIAELVGSVGAQVRTATTHDGALRALRGSGRIDLIVLDIMMNGVPSGIELARRSRSLRPSAKVVVITGLGRFFDDPDLADCLVLRKPIRLDTIHDVLDTFIATGSVSRASVPEAEPAGVGVAPVSEPDGRSRIEDLIIGSVQAAAEHDLPLSVQLAAEAEAAIAESGLQPSIELLWQLRNNLGIVHRSQGRLDQARRELEAVLHDSIEADYRYGMPRTALNLALTYSLLGEPEEAVKTLAWATSLIGTDQMARAHLLNALGRVLLDNGVVDPAVQQLRRALSNYSALEVEPIRETLRWLAEAYLAAGDHSSASAVLSRLHRLNAQSPPSSADLGVVRSIEAALAAESGDVELGLELVRQAMDLAPPSGGAAMTGIAVSTEIRLLSDLGRHRELVERWSDPTRLPRSVGAVSDLLLLARSLEIMGDTEAAYHAERRAGSIARRRSIGLPTLVALTQDLSGLAPSEVDIAGREAAVDDLSTLADRTRRLNTLIADLEQAATAVLQDCDDDVVGCFLTADLDRRLRAVEDAVLSFDDDSFDDDSIESVTAVLRS